ncbi:MAG: hypothetical protein U5R48_04345 [Gammaproteobacteria bacterium]|nr:hypothetical protein [Gammaproteobacteria bacterium]
MLNRVIDGTIEPSPLVIDLVSRTRVLVPELRTAFAEQRDPDTDVSPLMERADVLASGGGPDDLDDLPADAAATTPADVGPVRGGGGDSRGDGRRRGSRGPHPRRRAGRRRALLPVGSGGG